MEALEESKPAPWVAKLAWMEAMLFDWVTCSLSDVLPEQMTWALPVFEACWIFLATNCVSSTFPNTPFTSRAFLQPQPTRSFSLQRGTSNPKISANFLKDAN